MADPLIPVGLGLEDDPEVYDAIKRLALHSVDVAIDILDEAAPREQLSLIRMLLPRLTGSLTKGGEDEQAELRAAVAKMYEEVSAALPGGEPDGDH